MSPQLCILTNTFEDLFQCTVGLATPHLKNQLFFSKIPLSKPYNLRIIPILFFTNSKNLQINVQ